MPGRWRTGWSAPVWKGPLSPLLSNLVLDDLDRELERRGHRFVRYADDCNVYVRSERAGQCVMRSITNFITQRLKLKVNEAKSAVARPQQRKFLGFSFSDGPEVMRIIASKALERFKWRQWQTPRRRRAALIALGVSPQLAANTAGSGKGPWRLAPSKASSLGFPMRAFDRSVSPLWSRSASATAPTAVYGPVRTVVWEGWSREASPYPELC